MLEEAYRTLLFLKTAIDLAIAVVTLIRLLQ